MKTNPNKTNLETLTLQEIQQLKGGDETRVDVINENSVDDCLCTYNNKTSIITNKNSPNTQCSCTCV